MPYHLGKKIIRYKTEISHLDYKLSMPKKTNRSVQRRIIRQTIHFYRRSTRMSLSPVLFTVHTSDCTGSENTIFVKYSDDTVIVELSNSIPHYLADVERSTTWRKLTFLTSTMQFLIDFMKRLHHFHLSK